MSHERKKKAGERKDKKMARMREAVEDRKLRQSTQPHRTDQPDIMTYKPGAEDDFNRQPRPDFKTGL